MECFGYKDLPEKLHGAGIHSLDNVMTLDPIFRRLFDELKLWFEAIVSDFDTFGTRKLNFARRARKILMLFVPREKGSCYSAKQTQSRSKAPTRTFRCRIQTT
jgi:hypothetical protein